MRLLKNYYDLVSQVSHENPSRTFCIIVIRRAQYFHRRQTRILRSGECISFIQDILYFLVVNLKLREALLVKKWLVIPISSRSNKMHIGAMPWR